MTRTLLKVPFAKATDKGKTHPDFGNWLTNPACRRFCQKLPHGYRMCTKRALPQVLPMPKQRRGIVPGLFPMPKEIIPGSMGRANTTPSGNGCFSVSLIAKSEQARSNVFDNPESVYKACVDMKLFNQEVLRVVLLDTRQRLITMIDVTKGSLNESLAHPRDIFRPVISFSAHSFILVHSHPSGDACPSEADLRLTRRISEAARILQIQLLDHVIIGQPMNHRPGYFSFKEAGIIG